MKNEAYARAVVDADDPCADAWYRLLDAARGVDTPCLRDAYARVLARFPLAAEYWAGAIDVEFAAAEFGRAANLFSACLLATRDARLFEKYVAMIRACNPLGPDAERAQTNIQQAFEFAIAHVDVDPGAGRLFADYLAFLRGLRLTPAFGATQQRLALRRVYQIAIATPVDGVERIWDEYLAFEQATDPAVAEEIRAAISHKYVAARTAYRARKYHLAQLSCVGLPRARISSDELARWRAYTEFERGNPQRCEPPAYYTRVCHVYDRVLAPLYLVPEMWHEAARFCADNERPDDALAYYRRGCAALPRCEALHFAYADFCEATNRPESAREIYDALWKRCGTPRVHIARMRFERRAGDIPRARRALLDAMASPTCAPEVYLHGARMELFAVRAPLKALAILEAGMTRHAGAPGYAIEAARLAQTMHDDAKVRSILDRALAAAPGYGAAVRAFYAEFERDYGSRASLARVVGEDAMHALADDDAVPPEVQALLASIQHISVPRPPEAVVEYATSRLVSAPMDVFRERHQLNKNM